MIRLKALSCLILLAFAGASLSVLSKYALESLPTFGFISFRFLVALVLVNLIFLYFRRPIPFRTFKPFAPVTLFWWSSVFLFAFGLQRTGAVPAQFIHAIIPVATALFATVILRFMFNTRQWIGVVISFTGMALIVLTGNSESSSTLIGNLLVLASVIGFALYSVLSKLTRYSRLETLDMVYVALTTGFIVSLIPSILEYLHTGQALTASRDVWFAVLGAGLSMAAFLTGMQILIKRFGPSFTSLNQYIIPLFVIVWALMLLDEKPEVQAVIGASVSLIGVWITTKPVKLKKVTTSASGD